MRSGHLQLAIERVDPGLFVVLPPVVCSPQFTFARGQAGRLSIQLTLAALGPADQRVATPHEHFMFL